MNCIKIDHVSYSIEHFAILNDIHLSVSSGDMLGIIGPNGAGKTTLLNLITGFIKPTKGKIYLNNKDICHMRKDEIARAVAVVPDNFETEFYLTVFDIVLMARYPHSVRNYITANEDYALAEAAIEKVGITHLKNQHYKTLSSGEKQKVLLARAIAQDSQIIVLDEPTSNLDVKNQMEIMQMLQNMHTEGKTILAIMHDINLAVRFIQNFIFLKDGNIMYSGNIHQVFTKDVLGDLYDIPVEVFEDIHRGFLFMQAQKSE